MTRLLVALLLGLVVPVATLRLAVVERWCCCPDPDRCHCPDHDLDKSSQPSLRACHTTQDVVASAPMPAFEPPVVADVDPGARIAIAIVHVTSEPHAPPPPRRPAAPS